MEVRIRYITSGESEFLEAEVSDRKDAEWYRALFESSSQATLLIHRGCVVEANRKACELFGATRNQLLQSFQNLLIADAPRVRGWLVQAMGGEEVTFDSRSVRWAGDPFELKCTLTRLEIGRENYLQAVAEDVTVQRSAERTLSQLSGRLLQLQDEERRRIARELHDTTGQHLGALTMHLSVLDEELQGADARKREVIEECVRLAQASVQEIRTMSYLLHPPLLDELGLVSALRSYGEGYSERTGVTLHLDLPARMERMPQEIETALFRIVQEGLTNIHRHSGSRTAVLRLKRRADMVVLELIDHGRGFEAHSLEVRDENLPVSRIGVGIAGMRERTRQLGGRMTISSGAGGTVLHVVLPAGPAVKKSAKAARR